MRHQMKWDINRAYMELKNIVNMGQSYSAAESILKRLGCPKAVLIEIRKQLATAQVY